MTVIHTSTRNELGLSSDAPASVSTYSANLTVSGFALSTFVTDGTNGNDTIVAGTSSTYVFGFGGNDTISNDGSAAVLLGGEGADTFVMFNNSGLAGIADGSILDFEQGSDKIDLSDFGISSFSDLTIALNTEGVEGSFANITSTANNLAINVSSTGGLQNLTASDFNLSGGSATFTGGTSGGSTTTTTTGAATSGAATSTGTTTTGTTTTTTTTTSTTAANNVQNFVVPLLKEILVDGGFNFQGNSASNTIAGSSFGDVIRGAFEGDTSTLADTLFGNGGNDQIIGGAGNDSLYGGSGLVDTTDGDDINYGGAGDDLIFGNAGDDILIGGADITDTSGTGNDTLIGGLGNDSILGNDGNDLLFGQAGDDMLHGGVGNDIYMFGNASGNDVIGQMESGDMLQILSGINGSNITTAADVLAASATSNGDTIIDLGNGNTITVDGVTNISASQIEIVSTLDYGV